MSNEFKYEYTYTQTEFVIRNILLLKKSILNGGCAHTAPDDKDRSGEQCALVINNKTHIQLPTLTN